MTLLTPRRHESDGSWLVAYDFGAHLAEWRVDGAPVVWISERAVLDGTAPIRGGVPLCFPWFAAGPSGERSPSHGVVRTATWRPSQASHGELWAWELGSQDVVDAPGAQHLRGPFRLRYAVSTPHGGDSSPALRVALSITNPATDPLPVEAALHTYLAVADIGSTQVHGLDGASYLDKVRDEWGTQTGPVTFSGETDRVYDSPGSGAVGGPGGGAVGVVVDDGRRQIRLRPEGATQTVVWNPWAEKAAAMRDLADEDWRHFVCVETAATADRAIMLPAGGTETLACTFTLAPRSAA
jgi:glucose-6-phosphate 1-epimerase